ncbi:BT4734/BF3469 family protein [Bacteroides sp. 51]|uniref:BT4734/BF3469 family protein n=1 Tax=Bacteroides sp. 51 TaxID=2302938 RepID=UPI0013D22F77|nr:BT4734/BF3469 family protein [Bacteroides sp. 51]NDV81653.1 hypothetical protein [Bacteroides sp. 51]
MKITQLRSQSQRTISIETAIAAMKTETKNQPVGTMRDRLQYATPGTSYEYVRKVPQMIFGGAFRRNGSEQQLVTYTGLVTLEINKLATIKEAKQLRNLVATLPQTYLATVGSSGKSVKILVPFTLPDGTLPQTREQIERFHAHAYREAVKWYQPQLNMEIDLREPRPDTAIRMTFDPTLYHNPGAVAIRIEQPLRMPQEPTYTQAQQHSKDPLQRLLPGYERHFIIDTLFETCFWNAMTQIEGIHADSDFHPLFVRLAENCLHSGIPEEDAIRFTLHKEKLKEHELLIRTTFRNTYTLEKMFGRKPCIAPPMTLAAQLEEFMQRRYQLRRNTIKGIVEYREIKSFYFDFRPLTKQVMNGITLNAISEGINAWDADIRRYVDSNRVLAYNPIEEYLLDLPAWDGKDRIRQLAGRVTCNNPRWADLFHIWFLSMVAHWQQKDHLHANSTLPLLVGDQGCGKSTFCLNILPPELREYYTDSIDFSNRRHVELALNRFALINMDEFDSISPAYQPFMKHILQKTIIQTKRPYGTATEQLRRYATFIATSNNFDLLTDTTGSRRFICIEVQGIIDYSQPIDYKQLYAQAAEAIRQNERYWYTCEEEAYITTSNYQFQQILPEEEVALMYFRQPTRSEKYIELSCAEILEKIRQHKPGFKCTRNAAMSLGRSLKGKFQSRRTHRGVVYQVVEITRN